MSSVIEQLEVALEQARQAGYQVRFEYFGGTGGGICEFAGRKVLFVDLALSTTEQLERIQVDFEKFNVGVSQSGNQAA
jgi:hypothetical protein